ncbi:MAG TPA: GTP-binding protein [Bradyrhizobium sp.]|nr:GTP-binding protein [Bradyrhizobium sp.]
METEDAVVAEKRLPVSLLTGFLGSGKTTVLNHLVQQPEFAKTVVVINEFGEIGLDHELIERSNEDLVLLQSGCLCCTIRGDLVETLRSLFLRRVKGEIAEFDRVVIETTGLADPAPILHTMMTDTLLAARYRLDGVIATIDAAVGSATLDRQIESVKQAAVADRLLLTKTDLAAPADVEALTRRLHELNPAAPVLRAANGAVDPADLFDAGLYDPKRKSLDVQRWLNAEAYEEPTGAHHDHGEHHGAAHHHHHHDVNRHDEHISAFCLTLDTPILANAFDAWLDVLLAFMGPDLLRLKGILNIEGLSGPVVIHGVQHVFHPTVLLKQWPSADRRSRIVFIGRDLDEDALRDTLKFVTADGLHEAEASRAATPPREDEIAAFEVRL